MSFFALPGNGQVQPSTRNAEQCLMLNHYQDRVQSDNSSYPNIIYRCNWVESRPVPYRDRR